MDWNSIFDQAHRGVHVPQRIQSAIIAMRVFQQLVVNEELIEDAE
jgi:hypothetical protein